MAPKAKEKAEETGHGGGPAGSDGSGGRKKGGRGRSGFGPARVLRGIAIGVLGLLAFVVVAAVAALLYLRTSSGRARIRALVLEKTHDLVPGLEIGAIRGDFTRSVELVDVVVRDPKGREAVAAKTIRARFDLLALLRHRIHVDEIEIVEPRLSAVSEPDGKLNLGELVRPQPEKPRKAPGRPWDLELGRLGIRDGALVLQGPDGPAVRLGELVLEARATHIAKVARLRLDRLTARIWTPGRDLRVDAALGAVTDGNHIDARIEHVTVTGLAPGAEIVLAGTAHGPRDHVTLDLGADLGRGGDIRLGGFAGLVREGDASIPVYDLQLALRDLDPAAVAPQAQQARISARLTAVGRGTPLAEASRARVGLDLEPSVVAGVRLDRLTVRARLEGAAWQLDRLEARAAGATVRLKGHGRDRALEADLGLDLDARTGRALLPRLRGLRGTARLRAHIGGRLPSALSVRAEGGVTDLALPGGPRVKAAALRVSASGLPRAPRGSLSLTAQGLQPGGKGQRIDALSLHASGDGHRFRLVGDAEGQKLRAALALQGTITKHEITTILEKVDFRARDQQVALEQPARVRFRPGELLVVEPLHLRALHGRVVAQATLRLRPTPAPRLELAVQATQVNIDPIQNELSPFDADLRVALGPRKLDARVDGTIGSSHMKFHADAELPAVLRRHATLPTLASRGPVLLHATAGGIKLAELPALGLARKGVRRGTVDFQAEVTGDLADPRANLGLAFHDVTLHKMQGVEASLKVAVQSAATELDLRASIGGRPLIAADGRAGLGVTALRRAGAAGLPDAPVKVTLRVPGFQLAELVHASDRFRGASGELTAQIDVGGTLQKPRGGAHLRIGNLKVDTIDLGNLTAQASLSGGSNGRAVDARLDIAPLAGGELHATAQTAMTPGAALRAELDARNVHLEFLRLLTGSVRESGGILSARLSARGTREQPLVNGRVKITNGRLGLTTQPALEGLEVALSIRPGRAELEKLQARSGGGTLAAKGYANLVGLSPQSFHLDADASRFILAYSGVTGAKLDGHFAIDGGTAENVTYASLKVPEASLWMPKLGGSRKLQPTGPHPDLLFVDREGLAAKAKIERQNVSGQEKRLQVKAFIDTFFVRGKDMDLEVEGNLSADQSGPSALALSGSISVRRGHIMIEGRRYEIDHARIVFDGSPEPDPELDIRLIHEFPEAVVQIDVRGTPQKPELEMTSDPPIYDKAQIISLVLTGEPGGQPSAGQSFNAEAAVSTMVLGKLADQLAPELGVDVFRVESQKESDDSGKASGQTDTRVEVGKYLSPRVYLSYVHIFGASQNQNQNEAHVEYRMTRRWLLETAFGDAGVGGLDLLWTWRY